MISSIARVTVAPVATFSLLLLAAAAAAQQGNSFLVYLFGIGLVYATAVVGLHLLVNDCGDISLAHGAQVALGGFAGGHLATLAPGGVAPAALLLGAAAGGALTGAVIALPMLRMRGLAVAILTLLLNAVVFRFVFRSSDFVGGSGGLRLSSDEGLPRSDLVAVAWLSLLTCACVVAVRCLRSGRFGLGLRAIRSNQRLARSAGVPVELYRIYAYTAAGCVAGVAGAMWVILHRGIAPSAFTEASSLLLLTLALLGGRGSLIGPMTAAVALGMVTGYFGGYGVAISFIGPIALLLVLIMHPGGLNEQIVAGGRLIRRLLPARSRAAAGGPMPSPAEFEAEPPASGTVSTPLAPPELQWTGLAVRFGGLRAVDGVSAAVSPGEVLAVVGPNGAGKTTLLDAIGGYARLSAGTVTFLGRDITRESAHARAAYGIRRTFQVDGHLPEETGRDHLRLGLHTVGATERQLEQAQATATARLQIDAAAMDEPLRNLPSGTTRLIEIAVALAAPGRVLLLDEPAVGLSLQERTSLTTTLRAIAAEGLAVVLIDHDTAFVQRVADRVLAMDAGRVVAEGAPADVFSDARFVAAYMGVAEVAR
jgi:ABC-type branched-subunit amino acid transport system ATPase component/ABC-type branched-subunit amino acid transport system permease subunit